MRYVANLRKETIEAFATTDAQPAAYLLSSHRISPSMLEAAEIIRGLGPPLFADNGTKPLIDEAISLFREPAREIRREVRALRKRVGHIPRGSKVPKGLRKRASELADAVVAHATRVSEDIDPDELLEAQLSMDPTDLIAQEDFATACLIALDLERETTGWSIGRILTRNRRSLRLWQRVKDDPRCGGIRVHAVLSAMDYNTARSVGRLAAEAGVQYAALGIAGITRDPSATDFFVMGRASLMLDRPAPRRYVRLAQILRGLADGSTQAGQPFARFHCLGLGAPRIYPVPAAALSGQSIVTLDATSPIHDAVRDRVLYDPEAAGDRATTREIVQRIVQGGDWPFLSPFTRAFRDAFGHDPDAARNAWQQLGKPGITRELLEAQSRLTDALPLFSEADRDLRIMASKTWIAHNHWVLDRIAQRYVDEPGRRQAALIAIEGIVAGQSNVTTRGLAAALRVLTRSV